jgi:hypothetical protein
VACFSVITNPTSQCPKGLNHYWYEHLYSHLHVVAAASDEEEASDDSEDDGDGGGDGGGGDEEG